MKLTHFVKAPLLALAVCTAASAGAGCSRNNIEAVNLYNEAVKAKSSNIDESISKFEQATQLDPTNHRILWGLAQAYAKKEQWDKCAATSKKAQGLAPTYANYYFEQGMANARLAGKKEGGGNWADAKGPLEEAVQKDSNIADAHFELAEVLLHMDDEQGALREYTKAIETQPDNTQFYVPLADLYMRLNLIDEAEKVGREGLGFVKEGDGKGQFLLHSLMGSVADSRSQNETALKEYDLARKACNQCTDPGQAIAFFNLGAAYAQANPPQTSQAMQNLQNFHKMVCKGGAKARYEDQCAQAQQLAQKVGGNLQ
jgi:tetratricopeptide (TPR) repeat protein